MLSTFIKLSVLHDSSILLHSNTKMFLTVVQQQIIVQQIELQTSNTQSRS